MGIWTENSRSKKIPVTRVKSLQDCWEAVFVYDWQLPLIFVRFASKSLCIRVISLVSDLWAHQTTFSTNHLEWFFTKKIFCKMFPWTKLKIQSFKKTVIKKRSQYQQILKISLCGERAWRNWFFCILNFLAPVIIGHFLRYHGSKKWPEPKKSLR